MNRYTDIDFLNHLQKKAFQVMLETGELKDGQYTQKRPYKLDEDYIITVFNLAGDILTSCQHAKQAVAHINNFRVTPESKKAGISKNNNTIYHLEAYSSRLESIYKDLLILVNEVFMLGNQPQYCTDEIVLRSNTINETRVGELVTKLKKLLSDNSHTNETLRTLVKINPTETYDKLGFRISGKYMTQVKAKMGKMNDQLYTIIIEIFEELDSEFSKRYTMIKDIS